MMYHNKKKIVLITRPKNSAEYLKNKLEGLDYTVVDIPCLTIEGFTHQAFEQYNRISIDTARQCIENSEFIIFVSINAVKAFFDLLQYKINNKTKVLAIGSKTAKYLEDYNYTNIIYPESEFEQNSEDFVNLPVLRDINKANIILVRGDKSREYIAESLQARKANLTEFVVYKTTAPKNLAQDLATKLQTIDNFEDLIITITSVSILDNFYFNLKCINRIKKASLLVASDRIAKVAVGYGFNKNKIYVSNTMNEDSIIDIINNIN